MIPRRAPLIVTLCLFTLAPACALTITPDSDSSQWAFYFNGSEWAADSTETAATVIASGSPAAYGASSFPDARMGEGYGVGTMVFPLADAAVSTTAVSLHFYLLDGSGGYEFSAGLSGPAYGTVSALSPGWNSLDVTEPVLVAINAGQQSIEMRFENRHLAGPSASSTGTLILASSEDAGGRGPYLALVPEPSSLHALLFAAAPLAALLRKRS